MTGKIKWLYRCPFPSASIATSFRQPVRPCNRTKFLHGFFKMIEELFFALVKGMLHGILSLRVLGGSLDDLRPHAVEI